MYEHEFELLWQTQQRFSPDILSDDLRDRIHESIFSQRPLKSQDDLIGVCKYYPKEKKLPKSHPLATEFIILGYLNNLTFTDADSTTISVQEHFGDKIEEKLQEGIELFRSKKEVTLADIIKWLEIADSRHINTSKKTWK